jgi:hypothetical protein
MRRQAFAVVSAVIALLPACFTFPPAAFLWARD